MSTPSAIWPAPTLLVHCRLDAATEARTALAADLARRTGGRLVGVAAAAPPGPITGYPQLTGGLLARAERERMEALELAGRDFRQRTAELADVGFRSALEPATDVLARESCGADLIVVGEGGDRDDPYFADAGRLALAAGRPVLVAPEGLRRLDLRLAVVAWKATRESRRAVLDASRWLALAESVLVLSIEETAGDSDGVEDVRDWLARRRRLVECDRRIGSDGSAASDLIRIAEGLEAGLIVAGAYSRAPLQERIFGGVTRELLQYGGMARLLSH